MTEYLRATAKIPASFRFDGRLIREGDEIACSSHMMAETLLKIGCFERVAPDVLEAPTYLTAVVIETSGAETRKKRGRPRKTPQYGRRDMRAGA